MRQKYIRNASKMRQKCVKMGLVLLGKEERPKCVRNPSNLRQKCVKNARNTFGGEHLLDDTDNGPRQGTNFGGSFAPLSCRQDAPLLLPCGSLLEFIYCCKQTFLHALIYSVEIYSRMHYIKMCIKHLFLELFSAMQCMCVTEASGK